MKLGSVLLFLALVIMLSSILGVYVINIYNLVDFTSDGFGGSSVPQQGGTSDSGGTESVSPTSVTVPEEILF